MAREKELYRSNLDRLDEKFPNKEVLTYAELATLLGKSLKFVYKHYKKYYNKNLAGISKTVIARELS